VQKAKQIKDRSPRAKLMEMCQWILKACLSTRISQDLIVKSFTITGTSNKMNGSEDDFLWHQSDVETCQEGMTNK
jgi:hypothetical protein